MTTAITQPQPGILLQEDTDSVEPQVIEEAVTTPGVAPKKNYVIKGIFLQGNVKNKNGRIYPEEVLAKEIERYVEEMVETNRSVGELGHPATPNVNLERACIRVTSLTKKGADIHGTALVLPTPLGCIVKNLIDSDTKFGVSSRGVGSTKTVSEAVVVGEDFTMAAIDVVHDPSAPKAFVDALMEGKVTQWFYAGNGQFVPAGSPLNESRVAQLVEATQREVERAVVAAKHDRKQREAQFATAFQSFLDKCAGGKRD